MGSSLLQIRLHESCAENESWMRERARTIKTNPNFTAENARFYEAGN